MTKDNASHKTDEIIKILLASQEDIAGKYSLANVEDAKTAAQAIAAFRKELIALLEQQ